MRGQMLLLYEQIVIIDFLCFFFDPCWNIGEGIPRYAMEGTAFTGQFFTALDLDDFAVRVEVLDLLEGLWVFQRVKAWYKYTVFYAKEVQVGPG